MPKSQHTINTRPRRAAAKEADRLNKNIRIFESQRVAIKKRSRNQRKCFPRQPNKFQVDRDNDIIMEDVSAPPLEVLVDLPSMYHGHYKVYIGEDGEPFDALLICVDIQKNANKYYKLQLLQVVPNADSPLPAYILFSRYERIGRPGIPNEKEYSDEAAAIKAFREKFGQKAWFDWEDRKGHGKTHIERSRSTYTYIEQDNGRRVDYCNLTGDLMDRGPVHKEIELFCELIFNLPPRKQLPGYKHNIVPLGYLPTSATMRAVSALRKLTNEILAGREERLTPLSNEYFTFTPRVSRRHANASGRLEPVQTLQDVKEELEILKSLGYLKVARDFRRALDKQSGDSPINKQLALLNLKLLEVVDRASVEYAVIKKYADQTTDPDQLCANIEGIFRVERYGEDERWRGAEWHTRCQDLHRRLLWHGSPACNVVGILKEGLIIAPGVPLNGSDFGKGLYFSDLFQLSAKYSQPEPPDDVGLVLLCEVVACPAYEISAINPNAQAECLNKGKVATLAQGKMQHTAWVDAGDAMQKVDLKGVGIPSGVPELNPDFQHEDPKKPEAYGNEYVVYDISQVKIRYIVKVKVS